MTQAKQSLLEQLNLDHQGLTKAKEVYHNPSYNALFEAELDSKLSKAERGKLTSLGAVAVDTGKFTGRSPKDKYIVKSKTTKDSVWWDKEGSDNQPLSQKAWKSLKEIALHRLNGKTLYVMDGFCGANPKTRMSVRLVTEIAWMAHFFKNMFIRPTDDELKTFKPDWTIFNACKTTCKDYKKLGLRSPVFVAFNLDEQMTVIGGTWYGGEIKKGIFSVMNYFLPLQGIGSFHCSANQGKKGDAALFFGLSGTGKTTLSADPHRELIGDDEHGWDRKGIFNLEGGCYAKTIHLSKKNEPDIYRAIKRNALLENVVVNSKGIINFDSDKKTENTRVSYPIDHIKNAVEPSVGKHPKAIIFLTCDAHGVLPPVSLLSHEQAMYHFLSGYTAKIPGTELGVTEPKDTFSTCFGKPFLLCHPWRYAQILGDKMLEHKAKAYLVNTGWTGGPYGKGHRISIKETRKIIDAILDGSIGKAKIEIEPLFGLKIPVALAGVSQKLLNPKNTWEDKAAYDQAAKALAERFKENFKQFEKHNLGLALKKFGPK